MLVISLELEALEPVRVQEGNKKGAQHHRMHLAARKLMNWYVNTTLLYGFGRAITYDYEGTGKYWNKKLERYETKDMLVLDKIGTVMGKSFSAIFIWTGMLGDDLTRLECRVRGKNSDEYK